jgi:hypothetical protein
MPSATIVFSTIPTLSLSWSRKASCVSVSSSNVASSITAWTSSSKRTGSTTIVRGGALPSADLMGT